MARKAGPRKPKAKPKIDLKADPIRTAPRATRRRRRATAAGEDTAPAVDAEIVDEIVDNDSAAAAPIATDLGEIGELLDGFARPQPGTEAGESGAEAGSAAAEEAARKDGDGGALVAFDPLGRYLAEIRRFPLLSREEEIEIAKHYTKHHDPADAYRLVTANLRLVVKIAGEFAHASRNLLDLIQEGNVGLMEAVRNFDPYRGIRFPSYAVWWVRAYIYRFLINNWRLVKIGTTQAQRKLFFNLRKETERLEAEGFTAQPLLLAQRMGVKESEVREMQERMGHSEVSLDQPVREDENVQLLDVIPDSGDTPEEAAAHDEWRTFARAKIDQFASTLKDKELEIFHSRLLSEDPPTLQEVGARFGISRERVRQIEARLKKRLKLFLKSQASDIEQAGP
ncbi:MAG TPA: RNA polymerase factor sigma-32 [Candidatus Binataceae bacterium]|nr:RNA polymerase factor sigma-32 [Candidatus Binataceae bacterium]